MLFFVCMNDYYDLILLRKSKLGRHLKVQEVLEWNISIRGIPRHRQRNYFGLSVAWSLNLYLLFRQIRIVRIE